MRKPNIGDKVITKGYSKIYDGHVLTITKITDNRFCFFTVEGFLSNNYYCSFHNFGVWQIMEYVNDKIFIHKKIKPLKFLID